MTSAMFLAQLLSIVLLVKGLFVLLRPDLVKKMIAEMEKSALYVFNAGMMAVIAGVLMIMMHRSWGTAPDIVISLVAWGTLLKGILAVFAPGPLFDMWKPFSKNPSDMRGLAVVVILFALYLMYIGFGF